MTRAEQAESSDLRDADSKDLSWSEITTAVPLLSAGASFAYVVGYFLASDLSWFPFFSLPEHIVFAVRALPVALAAGVGMTFVWQYPRIQRELGISPKVGTSLALCWIMALLVVGVLLLLAGHVGLSAGLWVFAASAWAHHKAPPPKRSLAEIVHWVTVSMMLSLATGYATGQAWRFSKWLGLSKSIGVELNSDCVKSRDGCTTFMIGHVMFAGNSAILFYDFHDQAAVLLKRDDIKQMYECWGAEDDGTDRGGAQTQAKLPTPTDCRPQRKAKSS